MKNRTATIGSVGMWYRVRDNHRLTGMVSVRNQGSSNMTAVSATAGYQLAF